MGVYVNHKYFYVYLEQPRGRGKRESTMIPAHSGTPLIAKRNRQLAEDYYAVRMGELARDRLMRERDTKTVLPHAVPVPKPLTLSEDGWCYVYFLQRGHTVKIGKTTNVTARVDTLRTANHEPVTLRAAVPAHASLEHALHRRFAHMREAGEWFRLCDEIEAFIDALNRGVNPVALLITPVDEQQPVANSA